MTDWKKLPEEKPEHNEDCIVILEVADAQLAFAHWHEELKRFIGQFHVGRENIRYWMKKPSLPKEVKERERE